jgi:hypothetical protein
MFKKNTMNRTKHFPNQHMTKETSQRVKPSKQLKEVTLLHKFVLLCFFISLSFAYINAQTGAFLRFSLGPGFTNEYSTINDPGFIIAAKNHAIGWGFKDRYAVYFSEFGAFIREDIGEEYQFINLDAYGLGFAYRTQSNISYYISGAYGTVHFSDNWKKQGDYIEDGYALAFGADKKWILSKRFDLGVGPLLSFFKTNNYTFTNLSINFWLDFYLFKQK